MEVTKRSIHFQEGRTGSFDEIEVVIENLKKSEDESINQLINGEISLDFYCKNLFSTYEQIII